VSQFIDHFSEDVLPPLLERLSSKEHESERGNQTQETAGKTART